MHAHRPFGFFLLTLVALLLAAPSAHAVPVLWTANVAPGGSCGGMLGHFVFDADTGVYSDVALSSGFSTGCLSPGDALTPGTTVYTSATGTASGLTASSGALALTLDFSPPLGSLGGTVSAGGSDTDGSFEFFYSFSMTGTAVPTSVPEPGNLLLMALGLLGIALAIRRKRA